MNNRHIGVAAAIFVLLTFCFGGMDAMAFTKVRKATALEGILTDPPGSPLGYIHIAIMSEDWKTQLRSTTSDTDGHWAFPASEEGKTYCLQFAKSGFKLVRIRVKITKHAVRPLVVVLPVENNSWR